MFTGCRYTVLCIRQVLLHSTWCSPCVFTWYFVFPRCCYTVIRVHQVLLHNAWCSSGVVTLYLVLTRCCYIVLGVYQVLIHCTWCSPGVITWCFVFTRSVQFRAILRQVVVGGEVAVVLPVPLCAFRRLVHGFRHRPHLHLPLLVSTGL